MLKDWPLRFALLRALVISSVGPLLSIISALIGGDPWDGFAGGGYQNSPFQDLLFTLSAWSMVLAVLYLVIFGARQAAKYRTMDKRYYLMPIVGLVLPVVLYFVGMYPSLEIYLEKVF
jgi:hypothetical protein